MTKVEKFLSPIVPGYATSSIVTASFTCKLYDGCENMKLIANGRFRLPELF